MKNNDITGVKNDLTNHEHNFEHEHSEYVLTTHTQIYGIKDIANLQNVMNEFIESDKNLTAELNKYSLTTHTHSNYSLTTHTHTYGINDITNFQTELCKYSLTTHTHSNFALTTHTHTDLTPRIHSHLEYEFKGHQHLEYVLEMENIQEELNLLRTNVLE